MGYRLYDDGRGQNAVFCQRRQRGGDGRVVPQGHHAGSALVARPHPPPLVELDEDPLQRRRQYSRGRGAEPFPNKEGGWQRHV